jgi:hypothetical protein
LTDKLVKVRVKGFPWWPVHVCIPLELVVADALTGSGYTLTSSFDNPSMFMLNKMDMVDFTRETGGDFVLLSLCRFYPFGDSEYLLPI